MKENESKIKLPFGIDDFFTTLEQRDDINKEKMYGNLYVEKYRKPTVKEVEEQTV